MPGTQDIDNPSVAALNEDEDSFFGCTFPLTLRLTLGMRFSYGDHMPSKHLEVVLRISS